MGELFREWWLSLALIVLAAFGGFVGSISRMYEKEGALKWTVIWVETCASAFAGTLVMLLCQAADVSPQMAGVVVGVCGWVGGRTSMMWLEKRVRRILDGEGK